MDRAGKGKMRGQKDNTRTEDRQLADGGHEERELEGGRTRRESERRQRKHKDMRRRRGQQRKRGGARGEQQEL